LLQQVSERSRFGRKTHVFRYGYTSLTTPFTVYDYDMRTRERTMRKQEPVLGGYDPALYTTERLWATAPDGTAVPIALVYKTELFRKDGQSPMLLYGYGSYGIPMAASFSTNRLSLVDRGWIYAIAHVRGGSDKGWGWFLNARRMTKKNTFTDFIACAEHLVSEGYTKKDKLFANGGSAGGMLMGAITNMRPDLFRGIIAEVPWMDVVTDMYNTDLPLTTLEYSETENSNPRP
jgi:oligopeptidase B